MKKIAIGIDFSKKTFDATIMHRDEDKYSELAYSKFDNDAKGFKAFEKWVKASIKGTPEAKDKSSLLFCGEHTGMCSIALCDFLAKKRYFMWLESALIIHRKSGFVREKNDKVDSKRIAMYALQNFSDEVKPYNLDSKDLKKLKSLYAAHGMLTRDKVAKTNQIKSGVLDDCPVALREVEGQLRSIINALDEIDSEIEALLRESEEFAHHYEILDSFKGVGPMTATSLIIMTRNFKDMTDSRDLGCYIGVVPHGNKSGTSVDKRPRTSRYRNREGNAIITNCVNSAIQCNPVIKSYYERLRARTVNPYKAKNNCKFKTINILLAMIRNDTKFDLNIYGKSKAQWQATV